MSFKKVSVGGRGGSTSDDCPNIDTELLLKNLEEDSEELHCLKLNNIPVPLWLLEKIFEALKTTKNIKHLSLSAIGMKDEVGLKFNEAFKENESLESLNLESNDLTNLALEPLFNLLESHKNIREFKCAHQKAGLGSRGEEAMAKALEKNENLLKIGYPFKVPSARSLADRCQIRNNEKIRVRRTSGEHFYNYKEEMQKRDACTQPWIMEEETPEAKNKQMIADLDTQKKGMNKVSGSEASRRAERKLKAKQDAAPVVSDELAAALNRGRKISAKR